ncbi:MAG: beta-N-acetylhexosaminidase [Sphingobacteriales bacterium]|nr:beta-N-acetylhexosaminidase [Sphingobacteriales bacterium]
MVKVLILVLSVGYSYSASASPVRVLPEPVSISPKAGVFRMTKETMVWLEMKDARALKGCGDKRVKLVLRSVEGVVSPEGYLLDITRGGVLIQASSEAGLFYGMMTLRQLVDSGTSVSGTGTLACVRILDYPRYGYRGMHLDVSRHFFGVNFIKQYLDILASFKINTFHWHLTDSHGWRLEIKQYPRLCSVGGWRADRTNIPMTIAEPTHPGEPATYGGFYTQEQVRDIVAYAAARFITVIPEIEMPGHCTAALVAYPQYADLDNPVPLLVPCGYAGDLLHNFCAGNDSTFVFLQNILLETMALFPSKLIHIGGDEVREGPWLGCSRCQRRMKEKGFHSVRQLQAWFTGQIDSFITAHGRRMIGWDEVRNASLADSSVIMSWHGDPSGRDSAGKVHDVVFAPYRYTYFDFYQSDPRLEPDITYAPLFLDSVYAFDAGRTLGGEACLWTENVPAPERVEYMLLPRLTALSEALWTPAHKKDFSRYVRSVEEQMRRWDAQGIHYAKSLYNPGIYPVFDSAGRDVVVRLSSQAPHGEIRYNVGQGWMEYKEPVRINESCRLEAAVFEEGRRMGMVNTDSFVLHRAIGVLRGADGMGQLTDGVFGTVEPYDGRWVSFRDPVVTLKLDLGRVQDIYSVGLGCMEDQVGNIYLPRRIRISISEDGLLYKPMELIENKIVPQQLLRHVERYKAVIGSRARYVQVELVNARLQVKPDDNLLFVDEIVVQ